ncbi:MAG: WD40 repeat domain-containing protein [Planctomycetes bacterium]|nr:WD40 repeat domain-containing protein [Planctomycetota bacterium]
MRPTTLRGLAAVSSLLAPALTQCPTGSALVPLGQASAPTGSVYTMVKWDPDGPGPLGEHIVCGGSFQYAGSVAAANLAMLDPSTRTWSALGAGFDGPVLALAVSPTGTLVAAGAFVGSGPTTLNHVARWNGSSWTAVGTGTDGDVYAAVTAPNGDLFVGGAFSSAGASAANNLARWNGSVWSSLGSGVSGVPPFPVPPPLVVPVTSLGLRSNGDLIVAGAFTNAGGVAVNGLARWNGTWSALGVGPVGAMVPTMRVLANDDVVVGGDDFQGNHQAQRWNGSAWSMLGTASSTPWSVFGETANGALLGQRLDDFSAFSDLRVWNGTDWVATNGPWPFGPATALLAAGSNELWLSGPFYTQAVPTMRHFDGSVWRAPADGIDGGIAAAVPFGDGFAVGGLLTQIGSAVVAGVALRQNGAWSGLGTPIDGHVFSLLAPRAGGLLAAGSFTVPSVPGSQDVVRWDGQQWQAMGTPPSVVSCLAEGPDGTIYAGGYSPFVARWDGSAWQTLGGLPFTSIDASAIAVLPNGDVVVGLRWDPGAKVQRWNGTSWQVLGSGLASGSPFDEVDALCVLPNGDLVAGGHFAAGGGLDNIARWDGSNWLPMGSGLPSAVRDLDLLPNGDLLATHDAFDDQGLPVPSPSRWDGSTWSPVPGIEASLGHGIFRSAVDDRGEVLFTGDFETANGGVAGGLASLFTNCPTTRQLVGAGCAGSAGLVTTTIVSEAWLGGTWRARTDNLPAAAIVVQVFGLGFVSLPLDSVLAAALPGCTLHVSPDLLLLDVPVAGQVTSSWSIPRAPALLAQTFRHQAVPFELGPGSAVTAVTASNAWAMTIGAW